MRRLLAVVLLPALLGAAELKIDHVTVAGRDLAALRSSLAAVGIPSEYGGPHANRATEMALTSFPDGSYLELIALQANADAQAVGKHEWSRQLENNAGPCAWAAGAEDLTREIERLRGAGIETGTPAANGRARPDGTRLDWETARVGSEPNGTFFPFLIRDLTPRAMRAFPQGKPTMEDFRGILRVVIAVRDLKASAARYEKAYGVRASAEETDTNFGARLIALDSTPVVLAAPLAARSRLALRLDQFGEGPVAFILAAKSGPRRHLRRYKTTASSRWFGSDIIWFDGDRLGWRLGYQ